MSCLLAKIKKKTVEPYRKITAEQGAFEDIDLTNLNTVLYTPDYKLDDDEWFKLENFDQQPYCMDILKNSFDAKEYNEIEKDQFEEISYLISVQNNSFYFQNITPSSFLRLKTIFCGDLPFGELSKIVENRKQIVIKQIPDAIYDPKSKSLIFKNLSMITGIFSTIGELYKEATQIEVDDFLQESFIKKHASYELKKVSVLNRRLITAAIEAISKLTVKEKEEMFDYVNDYCSQQIVFNPKGKSFEINNDNDLKYLLYGIHQRFYTTPFGKEKMLANSTKPL
jgi:hypothetical protein